MEGHSCLISIKMAECPTDSLSETEFEEIPVAPSSSGPLSKLKCPICPERKKLKSNPPKGLKRGKGTVATKPSIPPSTRVKEFPNENLSVVSKKLFCQACREPVSEVCIASACILNYRK